MNRLIESLVNIWRANHLGVVFRSIFRAIRWCFVVLSAGLIQFWILILFSLFLSDFKLDMTTLIINGVFLFTAMAIVSAVGVDYFFSTNANYPKWMVGFLFVLCPAFFMLFSVVLFVVCHLRAFHTLTVDNIVYAQYAFFFITSVYSIVLKTLEFINTAGRNS